MTWLGWDHCLVLVLYLVSYPEIQTGATGHGSALSGKLKPRQEIGMCFWRKQWQLRLAEEIL